MRSFHNFKEDPIGSRYPGSREARSSEVPIREGQFLPHLALERSLFNERGGRSAGPDWRIMVHLLERIGPITSGKLRPLREHIRQADR